MRGLDRQQELAVRLQLGAGCLGQLLVLGAAGLAGCVIPAWRASRVDPAVTLRCE